MEPNVDVGSDTPQKVAERARTRAEQGAQSVAREAQARAEEGKERMVRSAEDLSEAGRRAAEDLEARGQRDIAEGIRFLADKLSTLADGMRRRSAADLLRDAEDLARRNPALFIGGSIALGFAITRLLTSGSDSAKSERRV